MRNFGRTPGPVLWLLCGLALASSQVNAGSLLGDHSCPQWMRMQDPAKKAWASSFLAPLSLTLKSIQGAQGTAANASSRPAGDAVAYIDGYCAAHPEKLSADGAGAYFKTLVGP